MRDILIGTKTKEEREAERKADEEMLRRQKLQEDREMESIESSNNHLDAESVDDGVREKKKNVTPREEDDIDFTDIMDLSTAISRMGGDDKKEAPEASPRKEKTGKDALPEQNPE